MLRFKDDNLLAHLKNKFIISRLRYLKGTVFISKQRMLKLRKQLFRNDIQQENIIILIWKTFMLENIGENKVKFGLATNNKM